jgi:hypothetical protein
VTYTGWVNIQPSKISTADHKNNTNVNDKKKIGILISEKEDMLISVSRVLLEKHKVA